VQKRSNFTHNVLQDLPGCASRGCSRAWLTKLNSVNGVLMPRDRHSRLHKTLTLGAYLDPWHPLGLTVSLDEGETVRSIPGTEWTFESGEEDKLECEAALTAIEPNPGRGLTSRQIFHFANVCWPHKGVGTTSFTKCDWRIHRLLCILKNDEAIRKPKSSRLRPYPIGVAM
jgi:hypothetical protein